MSTRRSGRLVAGLSLGLPVTLALSLCISAWPITVASQAIPDADTRARDIGELLQMTEAVSMGLSATVGTAISPLVGITAISAWGYFQADSERRDRLPWYNQPGFWLWAAGLLALVALKDTIGGAMPLVKKPLDALELIENQTSALVAIPIVIPTLVELLERAQLELPMAGWLVPTLHAAQDPAVTPASDAGIVTWLVVSVLATLIFVIVWFTGHVANVLVFLNPIPFVDTAIKTGRLALIAVIVATGALSPTLGIVVSLVVFLICCWLFGWSFRLSHLGLLMAWDLVANRGRGLRTEDASGLRGFSAGSLGGVPARSYGVVQRAADGQLVFRYRRFLVLPERALTLDAGTHAVGSGFIGPTVVERRADGGTSVCVRLLPRYADHETALAEALGVSRVEDAPATGGLRDVAQSI